MKRLRSDELSKAPHLPSFKSEPWDVVVEFNNSTTQTIKTMAKGPCRAIVTATLIIDKWYEKKIEKIVGLKVIKPNLTGIQGKVGIES